MPRGVTLLELILVLAIIGLMAGAAGPGLSGLRDRYTTAGMAGTIAGAHNRARIHAVLTGSTTELEVRADSLIIRTVTGQDTTIVWTAPGPASQGIAVTGAPRVLNFAPTGITLGFANASFVLTRGAGHRQVIVSRLGRVRVIP